MASIYSDYDDYGTSASTTAYGDCGDGNDEVVIVAEGEPYDDEPCKEPDDDFDIDRDWPSPIEPLFPVSADLFSSERLNICIRDPPINSR